MHVGWIFGGLLLICLLFAFVFGLPLNKGMHGLYLLVFALLAFAALVALASGIVGLFRRAARAITIEDGGIRLPGGKMFSFRSEYIDRENIVAISKHESIKGRLIEISTQTGEKIMVQARHYCGLDEFLSHCKEHGFPVD